MGKTQYTKEEQAQLATNPNVESISTTSITYRKAFKQQAVREYYEEGNSPNTIFQKAGFDLGIIGRDKPKGCLKRWRAVYKLQGLDALTVEQRGRKSGGRPKPQKAIHDIQELQTRVAYLEAENDFLRRLKTNTKS